MSKQHDPSFQPVKARVTKVFEDYVVVYPICDYGDLTKGDGVTFSRSNWCGADEPQHGQIVVLDTTYLFMRGWRAEKASPVTPFSKFHSTKRRA